jgi:hypothetical protein
MSVAAWIVLDPILVWPVCPAATVGVPGPSTDDIGDSQERRGR